MRCLSGSVSPSRSSRKRCAKRMNLEEGEWLGGGVRNTPSEAGVQMGHGREADKGVVMPVEGVGVELEHEPGHILLRAP
jgi:hypothetical protein